MLLAAVSRLPQGIGERLPQLLLWVQCFDEFEKLDHSLLVPREHVQAAHETLTLPIRQESKLVDVMLVSLLGEFVGILL